MTQDDAIRQVQDVLATSWDHAERLVSEAEELLCERQQVFDWADCSRIALDTLDTSIR